MVRGNRYANILAQGVLDSRNLLSSNERTAPWSPVPAEAMRSTMVALDELTGLALFAHNHAERVATAPERWLEPVGAGYMAEPLLRPLATRPLG